MDFIKELRKHIISHQKKANVDNFVFKWHYICVKWFLILCVTLSSGKYFGDYIKCLSSSDFEYTINTFCFFTSTFTLQNGTYIGVYTGKEEIFHQSYYQWVPYFFFFEILMFSITEKLWHSYEGNTLWKIIKDLKFTDLTIQEDKEEISKEGSVNGNRKENKDLKLSDHTIKEDGQEEKYVKLKINDYVLDTLKSRQAKLEEIAKILVTRIDCMMNDGWAVGLFFFEFLNLINIVLQIYLTGIFLDGSFQILDPLPLGKLSTIFPQLAKCTYYKFGSSGGLEKRDALCVLSMNILNDKLFISLWYLYLITAVITLANVIWRITQIFMRKWPWFTYILGVGLPNSAIHKLAHSLRFFDWIFFKFLASNCNPTVFQSIVELTLPKNSEMFPKSNNFEIEDNLQIEELQNEL